MLSPKALNILPCQTRRIKNDFSINNCILKMKSKLLILMWFVVESLHIKHVYKPPCRSCKYFIPHDSWNKHDAMTFGRCKLFGEKNLQTNEITFDLASTVRSDIWKCSTNGTFYINVPTWRRKYKSLYIPVFWTISPFILMILSYIYVFYF